MCILKTKKTLKAKSWGLFIGIVYLVLQKQMLERDWETNNTHTHTHTHTHIYIYSEEELLSLRTVSVLFEYIFTYQRQNLSIAV